MQCMRYEAGEDIDGRKRIDDSRKIERGQNLT